MIFAGTQPYLPWAVKWWDVHRKNKKKKWRKRKNPCVSVFSHQEKEKNRLCIYGNLIFLTPPFFMVIFLLCYIFQEMINLCIKVHEGKASTTFLTPYVSSLPKSNQSPISPLLSPLCSNRPSYVIFPHFPIVVTIFKIPSRTWFTAIVFYGRKMQLILSTFIYKNKQ